MIRERGTILSLSLIMTIIITTTQHDDDSNNNATIQYKRNTKSAPRPSRRARGRVEGKTAPDRASSGSSGGDRLAALPAMTGRARRRGGARWRVGEGNRRGESGVVIGWRVGEPPVRAHRRRQSAPSIQVERVEAFVESESSRVAVREREYYIPT